jgi:hypothetical protein
MKLKSILIAGIFIIHAISPSNVRSNDTIEEHKELIRTITSLGVSVSINSNVHCSSSESGSYSSFSKLMVICQDNRTETEEEVEWTENDLDTLRHESHHLIQDCVSGDIGDNKLSLMFNDEVELSQFLKDSGYSEYQLNQIYNYYKNNRGVTGYDLLMELEAFSVAKSISPYYISRKLIEYCS